MLDISTIARVLVAVASLIMGCGRDSGLSFNDVSTTAGSGPQLRKSMVETQHRAELLQHELEEFVVFTQEAGVSAHVCNNEGCISGQAGQRNLATGAPPDADTMFRFGSGTKLVMSVIVLQLVHEGRLKLDTTLRELLPEYPRWGKITVRQLLQMSAGLEDYLMDGWFWGRVLLGDFFGLPASFSPDQIVRTVAQKNPTSRPGDEVAYSNTNYVLLGMIVEKIAKEPLQDVIAARITKPLGLRNTYLEMKNDTSDRFAHGYMNPNISLLGAFVPLTTLHRRKVNEAIYDVTNVLPASASWAAGALASQPKEMSTVVRAVFDGSLLSADMLNEMLSFRDGTILNMHVDYGLGVIRSGSHAGYAYGHGGMQLGHTTQTIYIPNTQTSASFAYNHVPSQGFVGAFETLRSLDEEADKPMISCRTWPEPNLAQDADALMLRFKGRIAPSDSNSAPPGIGHAQLRLGQRVTSPYASGVSASLFEPTETAIESIEVVMSGTQPLGKEKLSEQVSLVVSRNLLEWAVGSYGPSVQVDNALVDDFFAAVFAVEEASEGSSKRQCILAVTDLAQASELQVCGTRTTIFDEGSPLRLFATIPLSADPKDIAAARKTHALDLKTCSDSIRMSRGLGSRLPTSASL